MSDRLLCIDTAGSRCAVGVYAMAAGAMLAQAWPDIGRGHAERLMGLLADVLGEACASYADIAKIAVVVGPGSFTGLRVGMAAAKGLALALDVPIVGVSTLEALAEPHWHGEDSVLSVIDAKRGEVYAALFGPGGAVLIAPAALAPDELGGFVQNRMRGGRPLLVAGTGAAIAAQALGETSLHKVEAAQGVLSLARIGAVRWPAGGPEPLYLRGADAKPPAAGTVLHVLGQATLP